MPRELAKLSNQPTCKLWPWTFRPLIQKPERLMTNADSAAAPNAENAPSSKALVKARFPSVMMVITFLYIGAVYLAYYFASELDDQLSLPPDFLTIIVVLCGAIVLLLWVGWIAIRSRWNWKWKIVGSATVVLTPVILVKVLGPVLGGDVTPQRWEPIWMTKPELPESHTESHVDLKTETPDDFTRFLGPNQNSTVNAGFVIDGARLSESKFLWKQPIGEGWSGFVVRNGFAVTMEQRKGEECVTCYDIADGSLQWMHQHLVRHRDSLNLGRVGPRSTPTIHDGFVYAVGALGHFVCLDGSDGAVIWQTELNELLQIEVATSIDGDGQIVTYEANSKLSWGRSGAPLIVDDLVVIPGGGPRDGPIHTLLACDRLTGELRWKGGDEMIAYGSPTRATVAGVDQILITAETRAMGFNPQTGETLWGFPRPGKSDGEANTSQLTVVGENRVLTSKGYPDGGGEVIALTNSEGKLTADSVWNNTRSLKTKLMSPLIYDGHSYCLSNGFLECVRLKDGERQWKVRGRFGHGQMLLIGSQILLQSESGVLQLFDADPEAFQESGKLDTINGVCWNTLCLYGNKLLVRSEIEAACIELPTN